MSCWKICSTNMPRWPASRQLRLIVAPTHAIVRSDRTLLRRIVQNYISNALRYTQRGGVLIGTRRRDRA